MKYFLSILFILFLTIGLFAEEAFAKRFGGGRSFGVSRSASSFTRSTPHSNFAQSRAGVKQNGSFSKWLGPLAGLAIGGLLASLFMGHGLGQGIMTWLAILAAFLLIRQFLQKRSSSREPAYYTFNEANTRSHTNQSSFNASHSYSPHSMPLNFDEHSFLREAKVMFNRLQAAYDQKDMQDLRQFTTPEVFAETQLQIQERGDLVNHTNVISLNAELLDAEQESQQIAGVDMQASHASVRFSGLIQENRDEVAASFNEIWHFKKEVGGNWKVAGVQQS